MIFGGSREEEDAPRLVPDAVLSPRRVDGERDDRLGRHGVVQGGGGQLRPREERVETDQHEECSAECQFRGGGLDRVLHILTGSAVDISDVTVQNGDTSRGGGILNNGTLTLTHSTVSGNSVGFFGGGIVNVGTLTLTNSTVSGNTTGRIGGGFVTIA